MNKEIEKILERYRAEMIEKLQGLIMIESETAAAGYKGEEGVPFGKGPLEAMEYMLRLGEEKGFDSVNYDNKACELNFGDVKEDSVGIVSHVDVVPASGQWKYPPYGGERHNGRIYGRGAVDDKGPAIAAFYAALAIKESGLPLKRNITQIIGTNEESGDFKCIKHYMKNAARIPSCGIVPDSFFPMCFSEKHIANIRITAQTEPCGGYCPEISEKVPVLKSMKGGSAVNVVPASAEAVFEDEYGNPVTINERGITAHASTPENGENAISKLVKRLAGMEFEPKGICRDIRLLDKLICSDTTGSGLGIYVRDETGETTSNVGLISYDNGLLTADINVRLPLSLCREEAAARIDKMTAGMDIKAGITYFFDGFYIDPQDPVSRILTDVYQTETGDTQSLPYANGSGSYARIMKGFVPYGIALQNEPLQFHMENENISEEALFKAAKIYGEALYRLACM